MSKWRVKPEHWQFLTHRQQKRVFKTGVRLAGGLMGVLVVMGLIVEAALKL